MTASESVETSYTVAALAKGLRVLAVCVEQRRDLRIVDIASLTGLPVPTVFRLLRTLETEGFVEQLENGRFRPGPAVLSLGFTALQNYGVVEVASQPLRRLADETAATVNLGILSGTNVLYLIRIKSDDLITANVQVGSTLPAACTSMGKVLLAYLEPTERDERLGTVNLEVCQGPRAVRSMDQLRLQLDEIRDRGWALQDEEVAHGLRSIAAPIFDHAGISASANIVVQASHRTSEELIEQLLEPLLATVRQLSARLGHVGAGTYPP